MMYVFLFIVFFFAGFEICESAVLFRIKSNKENVSIKSSYLFGTVHVAQNLIWPYLSNDTLRIFAESDQIWMEHDFTDYRTSKHIYGCAIDRLSSKEIARLRSKTWSRFLNETKRKSVGKSIKTNVYAQWRQWYIRNELLSQNYLWRNRTVTNDTMVDHRLILDANQRGIHVGSLESIPNNCAYMGTMKNNKKSPKPIPSSVENFISRLYNCDMIGEDFVNKALKNAQLVETKKRNQQITKQIRKLLKRDPHKKYVFAVGAGHLFGNVSIVQMLESQFNKEYYIEQIEPPSFNFPDQLCTNEEFVQLAQEINSVQNKTIGKRSVNDNLFEWSSMALLD